MIGLPRKSILLLAVLISVTALLSGCTLAKTTITPAPLVLAQNYSCLEISPLLSNTTYVDDPACIKTIADLLNSAVLTPVTSNLAEGTAPGEMTINGTTYPRNIRLDFVGKNGSNFFSILLFGDYIKIGDQYFSPSIAVTDEFISILDDIFNQGLSNSDKEF